MKKPFLLILLCLFAGCAVPELGIERPFPESGFEFFSGTDDSAGNMYVGITTLEHADSDTLVVLVPMVHMADAAFYRRIQEEFDRADIVLKEGVWGAPSLSPTQFYLNYLLNMQKRMAYHLDLVHEGEGLERCPNWKFADLSLGEFQSRMPWWSPFLHVLQLPLMVLVIEPMNFTLWLSGLAHDTVGRGEKLEVSLQHSLSNMNVEEDEVDKESLVLAGAITERNNNLLVEIEKAIADPLIHRIAVPWGAGHMYHLQEKLQERGFAVTGHQWAPAISLRGRLVEGTMEEDLPTDFMIPYLVQWRSFNTAWYLSLALGTVKTGQGTKGYELSLLWDLLLSTRSSAEDAHIQVLPSLFSRPLLFEWARKGEKQRLRFLLFFEIGSL